MSQRKETRRQPSKVPFETSVLTMPRAREELYMSARIPPITDTGVDAPMPANVRKTTRLAKVGATAQAMTKMVNMTKVQIMTILRP